MDASFERIGGQEPDGTPLSPVVLSVPHAGRDYPLALRTALRVPEAALVVLEDRYVDHVAQGARSIETMLVQHRARAWIDLNRSETERDARVDEGARAHSQPTASAKLRSGLGLVPRRAGAAGDLWRRRFTGAEVAARIVEDYRPYHEALAMTLAAARDRFGIAVLLDIHSMPAVGPHARIVLGDRFGQASAGRFVTRLEAAAAQTGVRTALNTPYAGGHILERQGAPSRNIHAIQIEIDRTLYLDPMLDRPGTGMAQTIATLRTMIDAVTDEAMAGQAGATALAAE
ncbi:N-formylglutamate amidohydrolase [Sphingomonas sp. Leaf37]|uniref:N-formylglutamate amidohydrolase n=1 Tax=Sphingomonas sp. Leaf37 TaxID=2876552 RepID=UPI001E2D6C7B|nr:N-formylglutamate amidohydrolase [Sphingomonas sp. Leaf37]